MHESQKKNLSPASKEVRKMNDKTTFTLIDVEKLISDLGYDWSEQDMKQFLDYNLHRGRIKNWEFAARRWNEKVLKHNQNALR